MISLKAEGKMISPNLELGAGCEVRRQLLDEREQHRLAEGAGVLAEHLLGFDGLTHVQHQVEVRCRQRLERKSDTTRFSHSQALSKTTLLETSVKPACFFMLMLCVVGN